MQTIQKLISKYNSRIEDCQNQIEDDKLALDASHDEDASWLTEDIFSLNTQISIYECIIKDLKELENETSR